MEKLNLLIDVGNSTIKIGAVQNYKLKIITYADYFKRNFLNTFKELFHAYFRDNYAIFENIGVSVSNLSVKDIIIKAAGKKFSEKFYFVNTSYSLPIKFLYEKTLGSDRICSALASRMLYPERKNILIVDFGTATTINLIKSNNFLGGLILPGYKSSIEGLISNTSLPYPKIKLYKNIIYNKTIDNISAGAYFLTLCAISQIIQTLRKKHNNLFVIFTGGLSKYFAKSLKHNVIDEDLVLKGINYYLELRKDAKQK